MREPPGESRTGSWLRAWRHYVRSRRGASAVELALVLPILTLPFLNVIDLAWYAFSNMQVQNGAQMGAQAALADCGANWTYVPALTKCTSAKSALGVSVTTAVTQAVQSTILGTGVTLASGYPQEGYYCATSTNTLVAVPATTTSCDTYLGGLSPAQTSAYTGEVPGDYLLVKTTYGFTPPINLSFLAVTSFMSPTITSKVFYVRLN